MQVKLDADVSTEIMRLKDLHGRSAGKEASIHLRMRFWPEKFFDGLAYLGEHKWENTKDFVPVKKAETTLAEIESLGMHAKGANWNKPNRDGSCTMMVWSGRKWVKDKSC